jgi:type II secretory pathway component PulJ
MRKGRQHRGSLLLEMCIAVGLMALVGAGLASLLRNTYRMSEFTLNQNSSSAEARTQMDMLADQLRNAQSYTSGTVKKVFASASNSDMTIYLNSTGDTARYWLDTSVSPAAFKQSKTVSGVTTTTTLLTGMSSLQFTYYQQASSSYTAASSGWTTTLDSHNPTSLELPKIGTVVVSITVTQSGCSNQFNSRIRLRNSPYL